MARADLLKKLFRSYRGGDQVAFMEAAREIVDDERRKHHTILAQELTRILENGSSPPRGHGFALEPLPKDSDRGVPLIEIRKPDRFFKDLVLHEEQRALLFEVMHEFKHWEVLEANGLRARHKLLFCGPPGCGKTATAEAIASELEIPLLYVRFDAVVSSLLGETASNLRKVFDYASRGIWVVLFDEFDAIGRSRDDATEHGELKRVVNSFLQMLDRFLSRSLVIAATNFEQSLDPALWRRFDEVIRFERPNREQIAQLLEKKLSHHPHPRFTEEAVLERLEGMSHAEIERLCLDMLRRITLRGDKKLSRDDLQIALQRQELRKQALERSRSDGLPHVDQE